MEYILILFALFIKNNSLIVLKYNGEKKTICWHVSSDIAALDADTVALVKQYALLHETLGESER